MDKRAKVQAALVRKQNDLSLIQESIAEARAQLVTAPENIEIHDTIAQHKVEEAATAAIVESLTAALHEASRLDSAAAAEEKKAQQRLAAAEVIRLYEELVKVAQSFDKAIPAAVQHFVVVDELHAKIGQALRAAGCSKLTSAANLSLANYEAHFAAILGDSGVVERFDFIKCHAPSKVVFRRQTCEEVAAIAADRMRARLSGLLGKSHE